MSNTFLVSLRRGGNTFLVNSSTRETISRSPIYQEDGIFKLDYTSLESQKEKM